MRQATGRVQQQMLDALAGALFDRIVALPTTPCTHALTDCPVSGALVRPVSLTCQGPAAQAPRVVRCLALQVRRLAQRAQAVRLHMTPPSLYPVTGSRKSLTGWTPLRIEVVWSGYFELADGSLVPLDAVADGG